MSSESAANAGLTSADNWVLQQKKAFTAWVNSVLERRNMEITNEYVDTAFHDGRVLINFLEVLTGQPVGKYNLNPKTRVHKIDNLVKAMNFLEKHELHLTNVSAEDFCDCNEKAVLGFVWSVFITKGAADSKGAENLDSDELLAWCREMAKDHPEVQINNFSESFADGLAFLALIDGERKDLFDFTTIKKENKLENLTMAFETAHTTFKIPKLIDPNDLIQFAPDPKVVRMYVSMFHNACQQNAQLRGVNDALQGLAQSKMSLEEELAALRKQVASLSTEKADLETRLTQTIAQKEAQIVEKEAVIHLQAETESKLMEMTAGKQEVQDLLLTTQHRLDEEINAKATLANLKGEGDERIERIVQENMQLRDEVLNLEIAANYSRQIIEISKKELQEQMQYADGLKRQLAQQHADFMVLLRKLENMYDHFSDNLMLAKIVFGEKNLAANKMDVDKEDVLLIRVGKRGLLTTFSERHVALRDNFIFIYKDSQAQEPSRVIRLDKCLITQYSEKDHQHCLSLKSPEEYKEVNFDMRDEETVQEWLTEIRHAQSWWERTDEVVGSAREQNARAPLGIMCAALVQIGLPTGYWVTPDGLEKFTPDNEETPVVAAASPAVAAAGAAPSPAASTPSTAAATPSPKAVEELRDRYRATLGRNAVNPTMFSMTPNSSSPTTPNAESPAAAGSAVAAKHHLQKGRTPSYDGLEKIKHLGTLHKTAEARAKTKRVAAKDVFAPPPPKSSPPPAVAVDVPTVAAPAPKAEEGSS